MPLSNLDMALLSLQAYNIGDGKHFNISESFGKFSYVNIPYDNSYGFSASLFNVDGQYVIAYRGTDADSLANTAIDMLNGWTLGIGAGGIEYSAQANSAVSFYQKAVNIAGGDLFSSNIQLTGHSLGGGLAGYIAELYGKSATVFNWEPFAKSALKDNAAARGGDDPDLSATLYPGLDSDQIPETAGNIAADYTVGEMLDFTHVSDEFWGNFPGTSIDAHYPLDVSTNGYFGQAIDLHSAALMVDLEWEKAHPNLRDWKESGQFIWSAYFGSDVSSKLAGALGQYTVGGDSTTALEDAIAYSALTDSSIPDTITAKPFGDTALAALFDDAADLSQAVKANPEARVTDCFQSIANTVVEFSCQLALGKELQSASPNRVNGILVGPTEHSIGLSIDFQDDTWTFANKLTPSNFKSDIVNDAIKGTTSETDLDAALNWYSQKSGQQSSSEYDLIKSVSLQTAAATGNDAIPLPTGLGANELGMVVLSKSNDSIGVTQSGADQLVVGSSGDETVVGGDERDIMFGGRGKDTLYAGAGENYVSGGDGDDSITVSGDDDWVDGGRGNDKIVIGSSKATINFGVGGGSDVVEFSGDGDYDLALQNLNPDDIEIIEGGRSVYHYIGSETSPEGFWAQFITIKILSSGDTITFLENGPNVGPDGNGSAIAYNKDLAGFDDSDNANQPNQGKLDSISFADGTVYDQDTIWGSISKFDYWGYFGEVSQYPGSQLTDDEGIGQHSSNTFLDYVNRTYLQADPIGSPPPPPPSPDTGTSSDDTISPDYGDNTVTGGTGNDVIKESPGNDTYIWNIGDGNDRIESSDLNDGVIVLQRDGVNVLQFGTGIVAADLRFAVTNDGAGLSLSFAERAGSVELDDELVGDGIGIDEVNFADGTSLSRQELLAAASNVISSAHQDIVGTSANNYLSAPAGNFSIAGGHGDDVIFMTSSGSGTVSFAKGDGHDEILGSAGIRNDTLILEDINPNEVSIEKSSDGSGLELTVTSTGDSMYVEAQFSVGEETQQGFNSIEFADGTVWDREQIRELAGDLPVNHAPVAVASSADVVQGSGEATGTLSASDEDRDPLSYALDAPVAGLSLAADGSWTFDPSSAAYTALAAGEQSVVTASFTVIDPQGAASQSSLTINLTGANDAPTGATAVADQDVTAGTPFSIDLPASLFSDPDGDSLQFQVVVAGTDALPDWLTFQNGQLSGTIPSDFTYSVLPLQILATDGSAWASQSFQLNVSPSSDGGDSGGEITAGTPIPDASANRGDMIDIAIPSSAFNVPTGDTVGYSATLADGSALPSWLSYEGGHIVGTIPTDVIGSIGLAMTATNGTSTASEMFSLTVGIATNAPITMGEWDQITEGNDRILSDETQNTSVNALGGDDYITMDAWNDGVSGGAGNDVIEMFGDNEWASGGDGSDVFIFDGNAFLPSHSWVTDWAEVEDFTPGADKIGIMNNTAGISSFAQLQPFMAQSGSDVVINLTGLPTIWLDGVTLSNLDASDFMFGAWSSFGGPGTPPASGTVSYPTIDNTTSLDNLNTTDGNDRILGNGVNNTTVHAYSGDDYITTDGWGVAAYGDRGNDVFEINGTRNYVCGGPGYDYFIFDEVNLDPNYLNDSYWAEIYGFQDGVDKIVIKDATGVSDFSDLTQYITQDSDGAVIALPGVPVIGIDNIDPSQLDASDFIFESTAQPQTEQLVSVQPMTAAAPNDTVSRPNYKMLARHNMMGHAPKASLLPNVQTWAEQMTQASSMFGVAGPPDDLPSKISHDGLRSIDRFAMPSPTTHFYK